MRRFVFEWYAYAIHIYNLLYPIKRPETSTLKFDEIISFYLLEFYRKFKWNPSAYEVVFLIFFFVKFLFCYFLKKYPDFLCYFFRYQSGIRPPSTATSRIARPSTTGIPRPGASRLPAPTSSGIPKPNSNPGSRAPSASGSRKSSYCY